MGIFSRMSDIVNSNINSLLDSAEDPEKMIRLIIQEMEDTLVEVRSSSARVLADRKTAERKLLRITQEVTDWEEKAKLAISKGREDLARAALQEKRAIEEELELSSAELRSADDHIDQLNDEVSQLQQKLSDAKAKQKAILIRSQTVHSRIAVKRQIHRTQLDEAFNKFDKFERKMDNLEGDLEAMDLGREGGLAAEIDALRDDDALNEELAALKRSMQDSTSEKAESAESSDP
ncbi:MAG: phage shock protein PspA [Halieaceae bacterium]|jgi:phage shock protein A|nr:phage shock protein PspA [Halieaceae bacterium]MDG1492569.1 phage shock protein PspA [Luminiphilus sp.]MBT4854259.1 phage shock protein PspA [Halieaceae bacterium]MBT5208972.1 phage shock protein PspA [Halieaceae bacterium]MBT6332422.1 phage shock protein PspA [Halieaceae bacterium]